MNQEFYYFTYIIFGVGMLMGMMIGPEIKLAGLAMVGFIGLTAFYNHLIGDKE